MLRTWARGECHESNLNHWKTKIEDIMTEAKKDSQSKPTGKGRPTPTRKEREAANLKPIVGNRSKEAKAAMRKQQAEARDKARVAMMSGDERYLLPRDRGPQRKIAREVLDSRFTFVELLMFIMILFLISSFVISKSQQESVSLLMFAALAISIIEVSFLFFKVRKTILEKMPSEKKVQRGTWLYLMMRGMQPKALRIPKPVKRNKN
ncbi:MAG: DUF3043 domain-containing protein [Micrococcales bacterium]|nr:DUF3043 domain-containing protein [Micrococcales bacterium]